MELLRGGGPTGPAGGHSTIRCPRANARRAGYFGAPNSTGGTAGVRLNEVRHPERGSTRPLDGLRVLAVEQMQALPFATQLLAHLGADVVKVEHPVVGESGRGSRPQIADRDGRPVGATYLRNNLGKRSIGIDLKAPAGAGLLRRLVPHFDVLAENFKAGTMERMGLGYA